MHEKEVVSDDICAAGLHQFIAVTANILYVLKGDLCSFLAQSRKLPSSNIASIYALHTKANMPEAIEDVGGIQERTKNLIMNSNYPKPVKSSWFKFVILFEAFLEGIDRHEVQSESEHYINSAGKLLDTVNSFQELTGSLSTSVELVAVKRDLKRGLGQLPEFEKIFAATYKLAQDCHVVTIQIEQEKSKI